jgi:Archaeal/vacuolar-type H+-ATPase subunit I
MLRPERMSKVSVTGAKPVIDDVIESVHQQHVLHLSEYGGGWEGFSQGRSLEGAEEVSEKLITVRSLRQTLESTRRRTNPLESSTTTSWTLNSTGSGSE